MARTQRGSVRPVSLIGRHHASCATAGIVYGADLIPRSGWPYLDASCHLLSSGQHLFAAMSFGSPCGAHDQRACAAADPEIERGIHMAVSLTPPVRQVGRFVPWLLVLSQLAARIARLCCF